MMNASSNGVIPIITESGLIHLDDHGISKFIISSHTPRPCKTATSSPLLSSSSLSPNLRYVRRKLTPSPRALRLSSSLMEVEKGGENALFVSSYRGGVIAVADAGFNKMLTLPCTFPKELMAHASRLVDDEEVVLKSHYEVLIYLLSFFLITFWTQVRYDPGFLVPMLEEVGVLKIGNVGDCGLLKLLRQGQIIFSTTPQEHHFDCPIHLMLPLYGGGGGSNMTKKIFVVVAMLWLRLINLGALMSDAMILPCGHTFGAGGIEQVKQMKACCTCSQPVSEDSITPNLMFM
ncbi:hypothetical protein Bca52824_066196 [Brassica carinata]|uniref:Uncharacterized protein n=1 Tax=Brassica carinata TaxID=52824 RepID=A0A8X7UD52_BRACI|nr:hypothetical protein Bca52824_066196 [Brassica carinata]